MSLRSGTLYFAPNVLWSDVDFNNLDELRHQLRERFNGFYLNAARRLLCETGPDDGIEDFASGVIIFCAFDAISRLWAGKRDRVRERFTDAFNAFAPKVIKGKYNSLWADVIYDQFRNGLIHESQIKQSARFDVNAKECISSDSVGWLVNPKCLLQIAECALNELLEPSNDFEQAIKILREDFGKSIPT